MTRVALVTYSALPDLSVSDQTLRDALLRAGAEVSAVVWTECSPDRVDADIVVIRSTWDYHLRFAEFIRWIAGVEQSGARLVNPAPLIRWNSRKTYLLELERRGMPGIIPTLMLRRSSPEDFAELMHRCETDPAWQNIVAKPETSASAYQTVRLWPSQSAADRETLRQLAERFTVVCQPFLQEVIEDGELSLVFLAGKFSHAARKRAAPGDFRVQAEHGGTSEPAKANGSTVSFAKRALEEAALIHGLPPTDIAYARVDVLDSGEPRLMELELIEPELFLHFNPEAPARLASAILAR